MADLSEDAIERRCRMGATGAEIDMAKEIRRHRAAVAADKERIWKVVHSAAAEYVATGGPNTDAEAAVCRGIADRAAEQLATAAVRLTDDQRAGLAWARHVCTQHPYAASAPACEALDIVIAAHRSRP